MNPFDRTVRFVPLALAALSPAAAFGQPSYAVPVVNPDSIRGVVSSYDGRFGLRIRDVRGYVDRVRLHDGTIINPTGLRLSPGQQVTILGSAAAGVFVADEIDTPYASYPGYAYAYPAYPGYAYPVYYGPYPYYRPYYRGFYGGYPYYGGTSISIGIGTGGVYRGPYYGGYRGYDHRFHRYGHR